VDQEDMRGIGVLPEPEHQTESALLETDTTNKKLVVGKSACFSDRAT